MIIILLLYICFLCVPAFFFTYEKESLDDIFDGCGTMPILLLGFPGAILGYLIRSDKDAAQKAKYEEAERRSEIEAHERSQRTAQLRAERIKYYSQSPLLPEIIKFVTKFGTPYKISVQCNAFFVYRLDGEDTYIFAKHGIENLADNNVEVYALGHAINHALGNHFTIKEYSSDGRVTSVILERPLKRF